MRRSGPASLLAVLALALGASSAQAAPCPGATNCPYVASAVIGMRGEGTLRFPQAIARGYDGRIYVGDVFTHEVEVFNPNGSFDEEWGSEGTGPGQFGSIGGITITKQGTVYVADSNNRIERFTLDGQYLGSFGSSGSAPGQFNFGAANNHTAPAGGGVSVANNFLFVADTRNNRIQRFNLDGTNPFVIAAGKVISPQGLFATRNEVIVADDDNHRLAFFSDDGALLRTVGTGPGNLPGQLNFPYDVTADVRGNLYVADDLNHRIVRFGPPPKHNYMAFWGGFGSAIGQLEYPRSLTSDATGDTWVTDTANNRIQVFSPTGQTLQQPFGINGRGPGQFTEPEGIAVDPSGLRAVADSIDGRVELFNPDGSLAAQWGAPSPGPTLLQAPVAVAFDSAGNGYVVDQVRDAVFEFNRAGGIIRKFGGPGAGPGLMLTPTAIALDTAGNVYVGDEASGHIVRFAADGTPLPSIGTFSQIDGVAVTPDGSRIFGADAATNRITVLDPNGAQLAQYGGQGHAAGHFLTLGAIALDPAGNLWATERGGNRIQELNPTTGKGIALFGARGTDVGQFIHPNGIAVGCSGTVNVSDTGANRVQSFALANPPLATPCAVLPPVTSTPNIKLPTVPPLPSPQLIFTIVHHRGVLGAGAIAATARCDQICALALTGTLAPTGAPLKHHVPVTITLKAVKVTLQAGQTTTVRIPLSSAQRHSLAAALGTRRALTLRLTETAAPSTTAVPPTIVSQTIPLIR